ncbi:MAG: SIR2 family protein [Opitutaceae bacterium]|jgi:hypothetical protein
MGNLQELERLFSRRQFAGGAVLVLGAGVNGDDVPKWKGILQKLLVDALIQKSASSDAKACERMAESIQAKFDIYAQASLVEAILGPERLVSRLASIIYNPRQPSPVREGSLLDSVGRLCMSGSIRAVLTFNYDTYLEQVLAQRPQPMPVVVIDCLSAAGSMRVASDGGSNSLPIYHVHGLIPNPGQVLRGRDQKIVLSQTNYLSLFGQADGEATSTPLHIFRSYQAVFIGCSLEDWNMIRLLQRSLRRRDERPHYCLARAFHSEDHIETEDRAGLDRLLSTLWQTLGVNPVYFKEYKDIAQAVDKLVTAAELAEKNNPKASA